jgi:hypothetical protein
VSALRPGKGKCGLACAFSWSGRRDSNPRPPPWQGYPARPESSRAILPRPVAAGQTTVPGLGGTFRGGAGQRKCDPNCDPGAATTTLDRGPATQVLVHVGVRLAPPISEGRELGALRGCRPPPALTVGQEGRPRASSGSSSDRGSRSGGAGAEPQRRSLTVAPAPSNHKNEDSAGLPWCLIPEGLQERLYCRTVLIRPAPCPSVLESVTSARVLPIFPG